MQTSSKGILFIKRFEGVYLEAYQDIAGVWTIGCGHTEGFKDGRFDSSSVITAHQVDELLAKDLLVREAFLIRWMEDVGLVLNQNEFDALISFIYNVGIEAFRGSTAAKRLAKGDRTGAAQAMTWWDKATVNGALRKVTGLVKRRAAEMALFLEAETDRSEESCVVAEPGACAF